MSNDNNIEVFRNAVIEQRALFSISRRELSRRSGVSEATIKRLEDKYNVTLVNYLRIAKVLSIEINIYYDGIR